MIRLAILVTLVQDKSEIDDWRSHTWFWAHEDVDSPLQFLAFCKEWSDFVRSGRSLAFVSHLPVSMDGSCNGLQHFAALTRDQKLAQSVNLAPSTTPKDVYGEVAKKLAQILQARAVKGDENALHWIKSGLIKRSLTKLPR
jgi:Autographiviridae RNA polymerase